MTIRILPDVTVLFLLLFARIGTLCMLMPGIGEPTMDDRDNATAALSALCAEHGAWAVRVHDVRRSRAALTIGSLWRQYQN